MMSHDAIPDTPKPRHVRSSEAPLPQCTQSFDRINITMQHAVETMRNVAAELKTTREMQIRQEESTKGLWAELRNDVIPELKKLPSEARAALDAHKAECPALQKAMARARGEAVPASDPGIPVEEVTKQFAVQRAAAAAAAAENDAAVGRRVRYIAIGLGVAVAAAGWAWKLLSDLAAS